MRAMTRRVALRLGAGSAAAALLGERALAAPKDAADVIARFAGDAAVAEAGITVDLPESIEDGSTVPISVSVASPMTPDNHVTEIQVVSEGNPLPRVVTFRFSAMSGRAEAATRIRLAQAQNVIVLAKMSDGRVLRAEKHIDVTIGACTG